MIFGQKITNLNEEQNLNIYFSFINQGINSILDNNIISKYCSDDYYFILGYILLYAYFYKSNLYYSYVSNFFINIERAYLKKYSDIDLMRIAISFTVFNINNMDNIVLKFVDELASDNHYKAGFEFFQNIILDLNEDSDLIFFYLQINSGYGLELLDNKRCYKLSMISVEDIKSHIIQNIPKYFFIFSSKSDNYIEKDAITQVMIFNEKKILDKTSFNKIKNNIMNITIGMFHESGHTKFYMNNEGGGVRSPIYCVNKAFDLTVKYPLNNQKGDESGKFIDYFLYNSPNNEAYITLIKSNRSNELMNKNYFIGNLNNLNITAQKIVNDYRNKIFKIIK